MKKLILLFCLMTASCSLMAAPVSGTFTIPGETYPTIASAFADLNTNGVSGPCVFLINAGYTENALNLILTVPTASVLNPVTFKKNPDQTGDNPKIIVTAGTSSTTDGGIIIAGTDYVTFEKLDINASAETTIEWGYALVKRQNTAPFDGCQHVTINSCNITLNKSNVKATGIYTGNHIATATLSLAITATTDACNDCSFNLNNITNVYIGISLNGYGALTPFTLYDHNNSVGQAGGNTITNFGGANTNAYGIYATNQDQIKVMNNTVTGGTGSTQRLAGLLMQAGTSSSAEVAYNTFTVSSSATTSQNVYGIWNLFGSTAASNTISVHHNNISCTTLVSGTAPAYGILNNGAADTVRIFNNTFSNFTQNSNGSVYVIRHEASANNLFINDNSVNTILCNGTGSMTLVHSQGAVSAQIYRNELYDCYASGGTVYGIYNALGTSTVISKNKLYNINSNNGSSANAVVYGINNSSTPNVTIYNNFISDLKANMATNNPSICGMYLNGGSNTQVYFNTVYLNASSSGSTFGSAAIYIGSTVMTTLKSNLFTNVSVPGATGYTVAIRRSGSSLMTNYATSSNNNDLFAGVPGTNNLLYYDGTNAFQTLAPFQALVAPAESASFSELPPFMDITTTPYNLHIQTGIVTLVESGGAIVASPAITEDIDGNPRFPNAGYPDNPSQPATAPDAGADEFAGGLQIPMVTFHVDLSTAAGFIPGTDLVYIAGDFPGATWNEPGTNQNLLLTRIGTSLVYSITLALPAGSYQYKYFKNAGWNGGEYQGGSNRSVAVSGTITVEDQWGGAIGWANLQWPPNHSYNLTVGACDVYGQAFIANGITGASGQAYGLQAWVGFSTTNSNPSTWTNWLPAPFFGQSWDNDEFKANLAVGITTPGTYYYATRYQFGAAPYIYGGFSNSGGGFWDGINNESGVLTVLPAPPVAFQVTGGGSFCEGGAGLPIGLSGSEIGIEYQLYRNGNAVPGMLTGTGNPLSFGNQPAGTYTITGNNTGVVNPMTGSAIIIETPLLAVSVSIQPTSNPVATGSAVTFTAETVNGGLNPSYQWKVNGVDAGSNQYQFTYTPGDFDVITCLLTSSETCTSGNPATSNAVTMRVLATTLTLENITVTNSQSICYNALQVITVAGNGTHFTVMSGGSATMAAGTRISYYPGTIVHSGGNLHGYIAAEGNYCSNPVPIVAAQKAEELESVTTVYGSKVILYPNPASDQFTLLQTGEANLNNFRVEIMDLRGNKVSSASMNGEKKRDFSVEGLQNGIYLVRVVASGYTETFKLVVSK